MLNNPNSENKKRIPWSNREDSLLQSFVDMYASKKQGWKQISELLIQQGYERNPKDCRERYQNYLDSKFNKTKLTEQEVDILFELIMKYGNKWTSIAEKLNHRTDQDVKNQFYAIVKKVFRRLLKATLPKDQRNKCSKITASLRPALISHIFSNNKENSPKQFNISKQMKDLFKNLILDNKSIQLGDELDEKEKKRVRTVSDYLGKQNQKYLDNKNLGNINQRKIIKPKHNKKLKLYSNQNHQNNILQRILNNQHIFDNNFQTFFPDQNVVNEEKQFTQTQDQYNLPQLFISSRPPFYLLSCYKQKQNNLNLSLNYSPLYEPYQDTSNLNI
ncbi:unnamed protein product (macronuclear) [Paramecium tetraurelia]|uniref:Myb-like DNA-binding domain protein n=1 Tax=Paramecium tetraurelia TaxID=5888 RepID=A0C2Z4_PARTE|nr:uncharacterized protein GSPATT00034639001 [Paramecium tetraurelia]CAK65161.1 unnamed protein product [Paramecium tetraurelia]|eukprot:XP_001432558.1 hypothetical protein (macronuclear) [Paramecium tetraurelia strain d4-2]